MGHRVAVTDAAERLRGPNERVLGVLGTVLLAICRAESYLGCSGVELVARRAEQSFSFRKNPPSWECLAIDRRHPA
jgi:hypothetical protein